MMEVSVKQPQEHHTALQGNKMIHKWIHPNEGINFLMRRVKEQRLLLLLDRFKMFISNIFGGK